jgi:hypothetical protein
MPLNLPDPPVNFCEPVEPPLLIENVVLHSVKMSSSPSVQAHLPTREAVSPLISLMYGQFAVLMWSGLSSGIVP